MMNQVVLLEGVAPGEIPAAIMLILISLLGLRQGWVAYIKPISRFIINYRGWTYPPLAIFYGGVDMLFVSLPAFKPPLHRIVAKVIGLIWMFCILTFLIGFFWFPRFLLRCWHRRAVKAGVPHNDPNAMEAFKAVLMEQQREAAQRGD